jgi:hypothetical protein
MHVHGFHDVRTYLDIFIPIFLPSPLEYGETDFGRLY